MDDRKYHLKFDASKSAGVDAYVEYKRIVGDDDGGVLFTEQQYEDYKKKVLPLRMKNRLFTSWSSPTGMDCKLIGPETNCFCKHRYKQHKTDFESLPTERPILIPCKVKGCKCKSYHFVPLNGSQPIRCTCKHPSDEHSEIPPFVCKKAACTKCIGFKSSFTCGCASPFSEHTMIVETAEERIERGHPIGQATPYAAMGGLTGFSSLAEGYQRLDPSGRGAPSEEFLEQGITSSDNPFLRTNIHSIKASQMARKSDGSQGAIQGPINHAVFDDITERVSAMRRPGEDDMDYFERRYQEKLKAEREAKRKPNPQAVKVGSRKALPQPKSAKK